MRRSLTARHGIASRNTSRMSYKPLRFGRPRYAGILAGVGGTLSIWLLGLLGCLDMLQYPLYDAFMQFPLTAPSTRPAVLLISYDAQEHEAGTWTALLEQLQQYEAAQVIFTAPPPQASAAFYQHAAHDGNVIFGRRLWRRATDTDHLILEAHPAPADISLAFGVVHTPPAHRGMHWRQHAAVTADGQTYAALEVVAAQGRLGPHASLPTEPYRIHFRRGNRSAAR